MTRKAMTGKAAVRMAHSEAAPHTSYFRRAPQIHPEVQRRRTERSSPQAPFQDLAAQRCQQAHNPPQGCSSAAPPQVRCSAAAAKYCGPEPEDSAARRRQPESAVPVVPAAAP